MGQKKSENNFFLFNFSNSLTQSLKRSFLLGKEEAFINQELMSGLRSDLSLDEKGSLHILEASEKDKSKLSIGKLLSLLKESKSEPSIKQITAESEIDDIQNGNYCRQLFAFTYSCLVKNHSYNINIFSESTPTVWERLEHSVHALVNRPGFKCTAAIANSQTDPIEIQINFFGTIDFASKYADIDNGGPGQETLKKYERELLIKINEMIKNLNTQGKPVRLKLAGHSLGGALAKGFTHTLQRACAVQEGKPEEILQKIEKNSSAQSLTINRQRLKNKLEKDKQDFAGLAELSKIQGITLYALGSPGVSQETDQDATALTYYQDTNFLRAYNHYHKKDLIRRFGETEFLSGKFGKANITTHKTLIYDYEISQLAKENAVRLPFPNVTPTVMAAHNNTVGTRTNHEVKNTEDNMEEKFSFPIYLWLIYKLVFFLAVQIAKVSNFESLYSFPESEISTPTFSR